MSATIPFFFDPSLSGWSLGTNVRAAKDANAFARRIELSPQSIFADSEFDTTQTWSSGTSLGSWSILNNANLMSLDENTSWKSRLYIQSAVGHDWSGATTDGPLIYQSITGDFDIYCTGGGGPPENQTYAGFDLLAQDPTNTTSYFRAGFTCGGLDPTSANVGNGKYALFARNTVAGSNTDTAAPITAGIHYVGGMLFIRMVKSGTTFTAYMSSDSKNWTQIYSGTNANLGSTLRVGTTASNVSTHSRGTVDFIRNTNPYDTTSPTASLVLDSGANGTTWTMSAFQDFQHDVTDHWGPYYQIGFGTTKFQYGASDSNPPSLNGSWLTTASMQGQANPSGRYFKLSVQFNSANGYQLASFSGATINGVVSTGGGGGMLVHPGMAGGARG